jgi:hypothetical protein
MVDFEGGSQAHGAILVDNGRERAMMDAAARSINRPNRNNATGA